MDAKGRNPLNYAIAEGKSPEIIKKFLDLYSIYGVDNDGRNIFHLAMIYAEDDDATRNLVMSIINRSDYWGNELLQKEDNFGKKPSDYR